ncbi:MAG: hypothetical protein RJA61_535 [Candidatus Parcubacteria bacterium]|jgi:hypothetical protein
MFTTTFSFKKISNLFIGATVLVAALTLMLIPAIADAALNRQLEIGMSGTDVSELQIFLARDNTIYPQGLVTGYFGSLTKSAVSNFQARNGIATVGRVGPVTLSAINAQMGNSAFDRNAPMINSVNIGTTNTSATVSWNTTENAAGIVYYSQFPLVLTEASANTPVNVSGSSFLTNSDIRSSHSGTITNLQSSTNYNYVIYSRDASGNESITWPALFRTQN